MLTYIPILTSRKIFSKYSPANTRMASIGADQSSFCLLSNQSRALRTRAHIYCVLHKCSTHHPTVTFTTPPWSRNYYYPTLLMGEPRHRGQWLLKIAQLAQRALGWWHLFNFQIKEHLHENGFGKFVATHVTPGLLRWPPPENILFVCH